MNSIAKLNAAALVAILAVSARAAVTDGLVAFYPFSGSANDVSGHGLHGVVHGATLSVDRSGAPNSAYRFSGSSWIGLPDEVSAVSPSELTVSLWVLADQGPYTGQKYLIGFSTRTGELNLGIASGGWTMGAHLQTSGWQGGTSATATKSWTHLVGTFKRGESIKHWVNGQLRQTISIPNESLFVMPSFPLNSAIGIYDETGFRNQGFVGVIDDVRIYSRALSDEEVGTLYAMEANVVPTVSLIKAVKPRFSNLLVGKNYQLQLSGDLTTWTNQGAIFKAIAPEMDYPEYSETDNWNNLYFRVQIAP